MATPIRADVDTLEKELNDILGKLGGVGGDGGGLPKDQFEQLHAVFAKDGERKVAELNKLGNAQAFSNAALEKQHADDTQQLAKSERVRAKLDKLVKTEALRNVALGTKHDADAQQLAKSKHVQKKIQEKNEKLKRKILFDQIRKLKPASDHSRSLESWTKALNADATEASQDLSNGNITGGTEMYEAIFKNLEETEKKVREIRGGIKQKADVTIEAQRKVAEDDHTDAANALKALEEKRKKITKEAEAAKRKLEESRLELKEAKVLNRLKLVDDHSIKTHEEEIKKQEAIINAQPAAIFDSARVNAGIAELKGKKEDLTALQTRFKELGLPAAPEAPKAPAPDSGSSWTRSATSLVGAAVAGAAAVTLAANYGPSMPSLGGGNSGTAGGGGANGTKFKPRGSKADGNDDNRKGDNGVWTDNEL